MKYLSIATTTRTKLPTLPLSRMHDTILGKNYALSIVFVGTVRARALNIRTRKKTYIPNVLSFPLQKNMGEIYICPMVARAEAKKYGKTYRQMLGFLLIHGMLHLKGMEHGDTMEKMEHDLLHTFAIQ